MSGFGPLIVLLDAEDETIPFLTGYDVEINDQNDVYFRVKRYQDAADAFRLLADYFTAAANKYERTEERMAKP